MFLSKKFIGHR